MKICIDCEKTISPKLKPNKDYVLFGLDYYCRECYEKMIGVRV